MFTRKFFDSFLASLFCGLGLFVLGCGSSDPVEPEPPEEIVALREASPFPVGVAFRSRHLESANHARVVSSTFSSLTAEYEMKMNPLWSGPNSFNWQAVDDLVSWARTHDMQIHGHALLWHETVPDWLENYSGTDQEFENLIQTYITTVVGRYADDIVSWDVVNEAFDNNSGALRYSVFRRRMGDDFMARVFEYARQADPDVLLFYNDYGTPYDRNKRMAMYGMLDDFQRRGIPIDGVGLQMHVTYNFPSIDDIEHVMEDISRRGLMVHLSELDIRVNPDGDLTSLTPARSQEQRQRVYSIVDEFIELPANHRFGITLWGLRDSESWLINFWGNPEWPLLFDDDFEPKPAYEGFVEGLSDD